MKERQLELKEINKNYEVSSCGRVFSIKRFGSKGGELAQFVVNKYKSVSIYLDGKMKTTRVHRLVAKAFIPNKEKKPFINHKDGNKFNNKSSNLEWVTHKENMKHAVDTGLCKSPNIGKTGGKNHKAKKINQLTIDGKFIKTYNSMIEASNETKTNYPSISLCSKGKLKTAGGYKWKTC